MAHDDCPSTTDLLLQLDAQADDAGVRGHVAHCARCQREVGEIRALLALTRGALEAEEDAVLDAARRERFRMRVRAELADGGASDTRVTAPESTGGQPSVRPSPVRWWRHWWPLPATIAVGLTVGGLLWLVHGADLAAEKIVQQAVAAEARAATNMDATRETGLHVEAFPSDPQDRSTRCDPWRAMLPVARTDAPGAAGDLLHAFFAVPDDLLRPRLALGASFAAWSRRTARASSRADEVVNHLRIRVVEVYPATGPMRVAGLTVQRPGGAPVRVTLRGDHCTVVITPVVVTPVAPTRTRDGA